MVKFSEKKSMLENFRAKVLKFMINFKICVLKARLGGDLAGLMPSRIRAILGFHVTSEKPKIKLRLKILSFYLYRVKDIFKRISAGLSSAR